MCHHLDSGFDHRNLSFSLCSLPKPQDLLHRKLIWIWVRRRTSFAPIYIRFYLPHLSAEEAWAIIKNEFISQLHASLSPNKQTLLLQGKAGIKTEGGQLMIAGRNPSLFLFFFPHILTLLCLQVLHTTSWEDRQSLLNIILLITKEHY